MRDFKFFMISRIGQITELFTFVETYTPFKWLYFRAGCCHSKSLRKSSLSLLFGRQFLSSKDTYKNLHAGDSEMHSMFGSKALLISLYIQKSNAGFFTDVDSSLLPTILESTSVLTTVVSSSFSASVHIVESLSMIMECSSRNDVGSFLSTCTF